MIKVTLQSPGVFTFDDVPEPIIKEGEALIDIKSMGICACDICQYRGKKLDMLPLPSVQCHEFGGIIENIKGKPGKFKIGDKIAVAPHVNCQNCYYCNRGLELTCDNDKIYGINIDGGFAEKVAVPIRNLVKLNEDFDIRFSSIVEPATVAYHLLDEIKDSNIVIIGAGSIGVMAVPIAKNNNNKVIIVDIDDDHLKVSKKLGADLVLNYKDDNRDEKIQEFLDGEKIDFVGLTFLNEDLLDWSIDLLRRCGTISFIAIVDKPILKVNFIKMWQKILTIKGLDSFYFREFEETAKLINNGIIKPEEMISKIFPLKKIKEAYDYKIKNNALKVILTN